MAGTEVLTIKLIRTKARYGHLDRLNLALKGINHEDTGKVEEKKKEILVFCKEETEKTICNQDQQEIGDWLDKIAETGVDREAREKVWFKCAQQVYWNLEEFNKNKKEKSQTDDTGDTSKPSDYAINVLLTTFILLGQNQSELSTWQEIWTKLNQTNVNQLLQTLVSFDDSKLTQEQVDLADSKVMGCTGRFHNDQFYYSIYSWCLNRVKAFRSREKSTKSN